jgi:hypothetical protein
MKSIFSALCIRAILLTMRDHAQVIEVNPSNEHRLFMVLFITNGGGV